MARQELQEMRAASPAAPAPSHQTVPASGATVRFEPLFNVVLLDDDEHTYQYVVAMLCDLFRMGFEMAFQMARAVDTTGRVVVHTADRRTAQQERDAIRNYGPDPLLPQSTGSMDAVIEPLPGA